MSKSITVVGVGALGSHLVPLLRNTGSDIAVVDFDRVEQKNVLSQFHPASTVGKKKVASVQQTANFLFGLRVRAIPHKLVEGNAKEILGGSDLVVDCLDNAAGRAIVQGYVRSASIPCLHGALAQDGAFGMSVWDESFKIDSEAGLGAATCEDGAHLPFIALTAAHMARSVQIFLESGKKVGFSISPVSSIAL
jgi:predicted ThiF/HesA family dinucleotide-utilizing enzyme